MRTKQQQAKLQRAKQQIAGFTLVELMIVVAIVGILSSIAFSFVCVSNADTYTITATGIGSAGMTGYSYDINENNVKNSSVPGGSGACWIMRKGGSC